MKKESAFFKEFKEFIAKGNVVDMAVGVVVGAAFKAIVDSLVADIITPIIGLLCGGVNFAELSFGIGEAQICYGNFIQSVINFFIVAFVLFSFVKAVNKIRSIGKKEETEEKAE